jgi:hypothetical protein
MVPSWQRCFSRVESSHQRRSKFHTRTGPPVSTGFSDYCTAEKFLPRVFAGEKGTQRGFDPLDPQPLRDEHVGATGADPRPGIEMARRIDQVMDGVERHRARPPRHIEQGLVAQHFFAVRMQQQREPRPRTAPMRAADRAGSRRSRCPPSGPEAPRHESRSKTRNARLQQPGRRRGILRVEDRGRRVDPADRGAKRARVRAFEVGLGQHDAIGDRDLLARFRMARELREAVHGIEGRDDRRHARTCGAARIGGERE